MPSLQNLIVLTGRFVAITTSHTTFTASIALAHRPEQDLAASLNHRQACGLYAFSRMIASVKCLHLGRRVECRPAVAWLTRSANTKKLLASPCTPFASRACTVSFIASLTYKSNSSPCAYCTSIYPLHSSLSSCCVFHYCIILSLHLLHSLSCSLLCHWLCPC